MTRAFFNTFQRRKTRCVSQRRGSESCGSDWHCLFSVALPAPSPSPLQRGGRLRKASGASALRRCGHISKHCCMSSQRMIDDTDLILTRLDNDRFVSTRPRSRGKQEKPPGSKRFFSHIQYQYIHATALPLACRMAGNR